MIRLSLILLILPSILFAQEVNYDVSHHQDTIKLEEVSVSASSKRKMSGMLSGNLQLNVAELQAVPSISGTTDVLKLMELTPSVRTSGDGSSNMYVRGGDAGQNLILYNDVPSYTSGHILGIFPLFNADHLSWVKMTKNGAETVAGNFISSLIEAQSKDALPTNISIKGNAGLLASQFTLALPISKNWGAYFSARKTYLELLAQPLIEKTFSSSDNKSELEYDFWDTNLTVLGKLNNNHRLSFDVMMSGDRLKIHDQDIVINGALKWKNILSSATLRSDLSEELALNQTLSFSHFNNRLYTRQGDMSVDLKSKIEDFSYKNKFSFWLDNLSLDAGASYTYHRITPHDLNLSNSGITANSIAEDELEAHDFVPYIAAQWRANNRLLLKASMRYNIFTSRAISNHFKTFNAVDARISFQYKLKENTFLKANYNHNNQFVNKLTPSSVGLPTDFWVLANEKLKPQHGDEVSVGYYKLLPKTQIELSADIYYRTMNNVTQFDYNFIENDNTSFVDKIAYGRGRAYGLEVMIKKNFGKLTGWLSYTLSKSDRKFDTVNNGKRFRARYDRTHDLSLTSHYKFNTKWDISLTYIYATGNRYTQPTSWYFINNLPVKEYTEYNNAKLPDYSRVDIGINYWFKKDNGLNLSLYNMLAKDNPIYVFMVLKKGDENHIFLEMKKKRLYKIIPSISWNFKF